MASISVVFFLCVFVFYSLCFRHLSLFACLKYIFPCWTKRFGLETRVDAVHLVCLMSPRMNDYQNRRKLRFFSRSNVLMERIETKCVSLCFPYIYRMY